METVESKKELLKSKVVKLVETFVNEEGGVTSFDLQNLFGNPVESGIVNEVSCALAGLPLRLGYT